MSLVKQYDHLVKLILVGSSGVGKSSLLIQFAENKFNEGYFTTIGVDFRFRTLKVDGKSVKFQILDTAGQERFRTITSSYYKGIDGIMMVYDVTDRKSFEDIEKFWVPEAQSYAKNNISVLLLGNKSDCQRDVPKQKAKDYATSKGYDFEEVSAKTAQRVFETIKNFGKKVLQKRGAQNESKPVVEAGKKEVKQVQGVNLNESTVPAKKKGCC